MAIPYDIDARRYYRVAFQRLEDGTLLLEKLDRPKASVYLTGYAVECVLKALLLAGTPEKHREEVLHSFRGRIGRDLLWLRDRLVRQIGSLPPPISSELAYVSSWSTDLRYEPGSGDHEDAQRFISATRIIVQWADGRL